VMEFMGLRAGQDHAEAGKRCHERRDHRLGGVPDQSRSSGGNHRLHVAGTSASQGTGCTHRPILFRCGSGKLPAGL
jgi:hypothetical protein